MTDLNVSVANPHVAGGDDGFGDNRLLAKLSLFGGDFHLNFIRVRLDEDDILVAYNPEDQPELDDVDRLYDCPFETVRVPGFEGDYVAYAHPYGI